MSPHFDITDHGAVPDGTTVNTRAIQQAIAACHEAGGGTVWCGPGTFITGSLMLRSNVELHLSAGCRIVGSTNLDHYPQFTAAGYRHEIAPEQSSKCLIGAVQAENIGITGSGTIDGAGLAFYSSVTLSPQNNKFPKPQTPRPRTLMFYRCRGVRLEDVTLVDSPCWTCWLMRCETVHIHRVKIHGNRQMRNVDGFDIDGCRDVTVSDCIIRTEDDCIVLRAMRPLYDDGEPVVCENVVVTNCVLESACQGVRVGCPSDGTVRHCTLSNLVIHSTNNGINFDYPARYLRDGASADIHDISFSNVTIHCRRAPIRICVEEGISLVRVSDIQFSDFRIRSGGPCIIQGSEQTIIENIQFNNVDIHTTGDDAILTRRARRVRLNNVELSNLAD